MVEKSFLFIKRWYRTNEPLLGLKWHHSATQSWSFPEPPHPPVTSCIPLFTLITRQAGRRSGQYAVSVYNIYKKIRQDCAHRRHPASRSLGTKTRGRKKSFPRGENCMKQNLGKRKKRGKNPNGKKEIKKKIIIIKPEASQKPKQPCYHIIPVIHTFDSATFKESEY